jgi:hypothetical protein
VSRVPELLAVEYSKDEGPPSPHQRAPDERKTEPALISSVQIGVCNGYPHWRKLRMELGLQNLEVPIPIESIVITKWIVVVVVVVMVVVVVNMVDVVMTAVVPKVVAVLPGKVVVMMGVVNQWAMKAFFCKPLFHARFKILNVGRQVWHRFRLSSLSHLLPLSHSNWQSRRRQRRSMENSLMPGTLAVLIGIFRVTCIIVIF